MIENLILAFAVLILTYQVEVFERDRAYSNQREIAARELAVAQSSISLKLVEGLSLIEEMRILLSQNVNWTAAEFDEYASALTVDHPEIRNVAVARNYIIDYVSPLLGNEAALNLDYRDVPTQFDAANQVISNGRTIVTNLIYLVQGGTGIIARVPFRIDQNTDGAGWGLVSIVWDSEQLFSSLITQQEKTDFRYSIKSLDLSAGLNSQLYGDEDVYDVNPILSLLPLDGNRWELAIAPKKHWSTTNNTIWAIRIIGLLIIIIIFVLSRERRRFKALVSELKAAQVKSEIANRTKDRFLANISHDLRTPLNAIMGFSQMMKDQLLGKMDNIKYLEYSGDINDSSKYLLHLVNDLLDISALQSGNRSLEPEPIEIKALAHSCWRQLSRDAADKDISLQLDITEDYPLITADRLAVQQILTNLYSNAIKFGKRRGRIQVKASLASNQHVIEVIDDGIGISDKSIEAIFQPFVRGGTNPYHRDVEGTGLGLSIIKALVELHGGEISVSSKVGKGTTFTIQLPKSEDSVVVERR